MILWKGGERVELAPFCGSGRWEHNTIIFFKTDILTKIFIELSKKHSHGLVVCEGGWWFLKGVDGS